MSEPAGGAQWHAFDYEAEPSTAPPPHVPVWIVEEFYENGVTFGFFDGFTFRTWKGDDDCSVSWWAPITYPDVPEGWTP